MPHGSASRNRGASASAQPGRTHQPKALLRYLRQLECLVPHGKGNYLHDHLPG
jgi:hypothetical protein